MKIPRIKLGIFDLQLPKMAIMRWHICFHVHKLFYFDK